jgi:hypothetical protein
MAKLEGTISITDLPPHRGLMVNLCFFAVAGADSPPPYNGDPPAEAATDCEKVFEQVDLDKESQETTFEHHFRVERSPGYYYVQLRAMLFRIRDGKVLAQVQPFFFARRPVQVAAIPEGNVTFPVSWPTAPLDTLYGIVSPQAKRPWWRFW